MPISEAFYKWIKNKTDWQVEKNERDLSLDELAEREEENPEDKTYSNLTADPEAHKIIIDQLEQKLAIEKLHLEKLPPKERKATINFSKGKILTPAGKRAKNRAVEKLRKNMKGYDMQF